MANFYPNQTELVLPLRHSELPELHGGCCVLKPLTVRQVSEEYVGWLNNQSVNSFLESRFETHTVESVRQYVEYQINTGYILFYGIWSNDGKHVGNIKIGPIDAHHFCGDIGFMIGNCDYWGRGIATAAIQVLTKYAFGLGLKKITAGAYETNIGCIKALERCGFMREGYRTSQVVYQGRRIGTILFGAQC